METELRKLKKLPSLQTTGNSRDGYHAEDDPNLRYTSLKDIIINPQPTSHSSNLEGNHDFDSSNITIRNRLVKRAASAYVQSAAIVVTRNQNYFASFWRRLKSRTQITSSCWNFYVINSLHACFNPIYRFLASTVGFLWNGVTRIS